MNNDTKKIVVGSFIWKLLERVGTQGVQFIVQIVLARLLLPEDFGLIAIVAVFITFAQVFIQKGFNAALIQKKSADNEDFSSVFWLSLIISLILYLLFYVTAPIIASFYNNNQLNNLIRVLSVILIFGSMNSIQNAYVGRYMLFKKLFKSSITSILISGSIGVLCAYLGMGVWALVIQQILNIILVTLIMWFTIDWRPEFIFSMKKTKELFSFGWKLLVSSLLNTLYLDARTLIIGRLYLPSILGIYNRGEQFPKIIVTNIDGSIQSVLFPALSSYQDDVITMKNIVRRAIATSSYVVIPCMVILFIVSEPLITVVLTDKWIEAAPFLQLFCFSYVFIPIQTSNAQAINALGRSDVFLKLEIIKKVIGLILLVVSMYFGVYWIAFSMVITNIIATAVNAYPNKHFLNYGYFDQLKDIVPILVTSLLMGTIIYPLKYFIESSQMILLVAQLSVGLIIYILLSYIFKLSVFQYIKSIGKEHFRKRTNV